MMETKNVMWDTSRGISFLSTIVETIGGFNVLSSIVEMIADFLFLSSIIETDIIFALFPDFLSYGGWSHQRQRVWSI